MVNDRDDPRKTLGAILDRGLFADYAPPSEPEAGTSPFDAIPGERRDFKGGDQWKFTFANGYGASVVRHEFSYGHEDGKWEIGVLGTDGHLTYDTPITDDVIGWLDEDEVAETLARIEALE